MSERKVYVEHLNYEDELQMFNEASNDCSFEVPIPRKLESPYFYTQKQNLKTGNGFILHLENRQRKEV